MSFFTSPWTQAEITERSRPITFQNTANHWRPTPTSVPNTWALLEDSSYLNHNRWDSDGYLLITVLWPVLEWGQFPVLRMLWYWYIVAQSKRIRGQGCFSVSLLACDEEQSHTCGCSSNGSGQGFRTVLVWMLCHKRRICGNWHPRTPWGCGNWYSPCGKQLGMNIESHPNTHIPWLTSLLGVYPKKIILKKEKVIHEGVMGALFSKDENQEMYKPQVGKIFRQRAKWYTL